MIRYEHPDQQPVADTPDWSNVANDERESAATRDLAAELNDGQHRES